MRGCALGIQCSVGVEGAVDVGGIGLGHCSAMWDVIWSRKSPGLSAVSLAGWMKRMTPFESVAMRRGKSVAANRVRVSGATMRVGVPRSCSAAVFGGSGAVGSLVVALDRAGGGLGGVLGGGAATGGAGCARRA
jgi:hypothetical protein